MDETPEEPDPSKLSASLPAPEKGPPLTVRGLVEIVLSVLACFAIGWGLQAWVVKPFQIPSGSMLPTLQIGQRVLVNRLDPNPSIGSIIVFHPPQNATLMRCADPNAGFTPQTDNPPKSTGALCDRAAPGPPESDYFVKRVVAVGGDRISLRDGHLILNGKPQKEPFATFCDSVNVWCTLPKTITVPKGDYFVLGDNRSDSDDSRFWGPVPKSWVVGTVIGSYWPVSRIGIS